MRHLRRLLPVVAAVLLASSIMPLAAAPVAGADYSTNCGVNLRTAPDTTAPSLAVVPVGTVVSSIGVADGGPWSGSCPGSLSGSTWYVISAVNGTRVSVLYGAEQVYAASGLFTTGTYLEGIDVSHYQDAIAWPAVAASGKRFAIVQATSGSTYLDPMYATNHAGARAVSLPVAAYHFAAPLSTPGDAVAQARWFVTSAALQPGDLIPALDLERTGGLIQADLQDWVGAWLDEVTAQLGVRPMIYTSPSFWKTSMGDTTRFADAGYSMLWVAHWSTGQPSVPASSWEGLGWTFWQYTNCGSVSGISGCVDLDRFNGSDLAAVTIGGIPPLPDPSKVPPVLNRVTPPSTRAGDGDVTVTIEGENFTPASTAHWNGSPIATTYVSPTALTAVVPAALSATPGLGQITVVTDPTVGASGPLAFSIAVGAVSLAVSPSTTVVAWGQAADVRVDSRNLGPNQPLLLQRMQANESTWANVGNMTTDATGAAISTVTPPVNTWFRAAYLAADGTEVTAPPVRIVVRQLVVLRPTNLGRLKTVRLGSTTTFTATVRPIGPSLAPARVTFQFWRLAGGRWQRVASRSVWTDASGRASTSWRFGVRGQWYVRAMADPTATNANSVMSPIERYSIT